MKRSKEVWGTWKGGVVGPLSDEDRAVKVVCNENIRFIWDFDTIRDFPIEDMICFHDHDQKNV